MGEGARAWDLPATRQEWRLAALVGLAWLLIGAALITGYGIYNARWGEGQAARLRQHGLQTTAVALASSSPTLRCGQVGVPIRYVVGGSEHTATLWIDGCGRQLYQGERFTLFVDPSNYHRFVTAGSDNESPTALSAAIALFVAGLFFVVAGGVRSWRLRRVRKILRTAGWAQQHAKIVTVPSTWWGGGGGKVVIWQTETEPTVLKLPLSLGGYRALPAGTDIDLVLARGESSHWAFARDESSRPIPAKEIRDGRLHNRALAIMAK